MTIKTVETKTEGLKRAFMLTIPAADIEARVDEEVKRIAPQVKMPGFRPGKVPLNLVKKMHGDSLLQDALNSVVQQGVEDVLAKETIRPALRPSISLDNYEPGKDAVINMEVEALPAVPKPNIKNLKIDRLTAEPKDDDVDGQLKEIASGSKRWTEAKASHAAKQGDLVVMDFVGKLGGKEFDGGKAEDMSVELGSAHLIPGFEDQLVGAKAGDEREVKITFPEDYNAKHLAGKDATFDVTVKTVKTGSENKIDDELATSLGFTGIDQLRGLIKGQMEQQLNGLTRTHMKRQLLDQLAERHDFEVPESMVDAEYENILGQLRHEASHEADPEAALKEIEGDAKEYRKIAERRVRLGLLLSEIGAQNGIDITEQEMRALVSQAASQYQPKDRETFLRYIEQEPAAQAQLRAPLYEDKVVDHLFTIADVTDRPATREEIEAELESEEGHVHGPDCGHDHGDKPKAKAKKAEPKKTDAKKAADKPVKAEAKNAEAKKPAAKVEAKPAAKRPAAKKKG